MKIDTGRFLITNAHSGNLAIVSDANEGTDLVGALPSIDDDLKGEKWNVVLLSATKVNKYEIRNFDYASYASSDHRPELGQRVRGQNNVRQWIIKETSVPGQYTISTATDPELFWGLRDDKDGTLIELSDDPSNPRNQWIFEPVSDLDTCVRNMTSHNQSLALKALKDFSSLAASQLQVAIQTGGLAVAIKLLSDSDTTIQSAASASLTTLALSVFPQIVLDLYDWKPPAAQLRGLRTIIDFALADQIKGAAVELHVMPHLVKLLDSKEVSVVGEALEALNILLTYPPALQAAVDAEVGPVLRRLVISQSLSKNAAAAAATALTFTFVDAIPIELSPGPIDTAITASPSTTFSSPSSPRASSLFSAALTRITGQPSAPTSPYSVYSSLSVYGSPPAYNRDAVPWVAGGFLPGGPTKSHQRVVNENDAVFGPMSLINDALTCLDVRCAVPYDGGRRLAFAQTDGVYVWDHNAPEQLPVKVLAMTLVQLDVLDHVQMFVGLTPDGTAFTVPLRAFNPDNSSAGLESVQPFAQNISFFKTGSCFGKPVVCIVSSSLMSSTVQVLEWALTETAITLRVFKEFCIFTEIHSVDILKTNLCLGCARGFEIVNLSSLEAQPLLDPADPETNFVSKRKNVVPLTIYRVGKDFLLCYDAFAFFVDRTGRRTRNDWQIDWEGSPKTFALRYPYLIAFGPTAVEIWNVGRQNSELCQVIRGSNIRSLFADTPRAGTHLVARRDIIYCSDDGVMTFRRCDMI